MCWPKGLVTHFYGVQQTTNFTCQRIWPYSRIFQLTKGWFCIIRVHQNQMNNQTVAHITLCVRSQLIIIYVRAHTYACAVLSVPVGWYEWMPVRWRQPSVLSWAIFHNYEKHSRVYLSIHIWYVPKGRFCASSTGFGIISSWVDG